MANPFLIEDITSTFSDNNNSFNPFVTNTTAELETHNDNPFFSSFGTSSNTVQDNTNPFLAFTEKSDVVQPVADLLGINELPQTAFTEDASKMKPPPPRPAPPKRPPPRPTPPSQEMHKELILSVTGEMDATSLHLLDRLPKTPSPTPMRDLLSPSPTPTADLLGYDDLGPPITSQTSSVFDQQTNVIDISSGTKPERPKFPPKIDFLMDDLLEDGPIEEGVNSDEIATQNRTQSIPENQLIVGGSNPSSRKASNDFIPPVRRLSHDVTESRKIMPDLSKIADRRKSDIGHFAPIIPSRKLNNQSDQSQIESQPYNIIQEINEPEEKLNIDVINNIPQNILLSNEEVSKNNVQDEQINTKCDDEKSGLDFDSQQTVETSNQIEIDMTYDIKRAPCVEELSSNGETNVSASQPIPTESAADENISINDFNVKMSLSSDSFPPTSNEVFKQDSIDSYDAKPIPPVPSPSPFQDVPSEEVSFNAVFDKSEKLVNTPFDVQEPQQLECINLTADVPESFSIPNTAAGSDAFDAFAAKFDDSQIDDNISGGAFDAFGSVSRGAFDDSTMGFGADDNFDSFLSTHQIPTAPQSTPAKVTRNNSGESLDENDFNVFIKYLKLY